MNPLISIMIATYNQPIEIVKAVESSLHQDYDNLEVVVGDDSTTDDVYNALQPYFSNKKLKYFRNEANLGRVKNYRKLLFELAQGEWVVMLDGDDYYLDLSFVSKAVRYINDDPEIVLVAAGHLISDENTNLQSKEILVHEDIIFDGKDIFYKHLKLGQHSTNIYQRKLAIDIDYYRTDSMGTDAEGLFRTALHGKVVYLKDIVVIWRLHQHNNTFKGSDAIKQMHEMIFIDNVFKYALKFISKEKAISWRSYMYNAMSYHIIHLAEKSGSYFTVLRVSLWASQFWGIGGTLRYLKTYTYKILRQNKKISTSS